MNERITRGTVTVGGLLFVLCALVVVSGSANAGKQDARAEQKYQEARKDLVAWWTFAETDVQVVDNELRNGLNGEILGAVRNDGAMDFDGADDYIAIRGVRRLASLGKGSISVWFKFDSIPTGGWSDPPSVHPILYAGDGENSGLIIEVGHSPIRQDTKIYFTISTTGETSAFSQPIFCFDSGFELQENQWYHFVAVVGEDSNTGYLNGEELVDRKYNFVVGDGDKQEVGPTNSIFFDDLADMTEFWIGKGIFLGSEQYFDGLIDDVRIYDEPLNSGQVKKLYEGNW